MELVVTRAPHVLTELVDTPEEATAVAEALHEIIGSWTIATPQLGRYLIRTLDLLARHVSTPDELAVALDEHAIYAGGHVPVIGGEVCDLILAASDSIRGALTRLDARRNPNGGSHAV